MDESDIVEEGPLANELFLVELIASRSCNFAFGLSSFKYTGMIGTEIKERSNLFGFFEGIKRSGGQITTEIP